MALGEFAPVAFTVVIDENLVGGTPPNTGQRPVLHGVTIIRDSRVFWLGHFCRMARYESHHARDAERGQAPRPAFAQMLRRGKGWRIDGKCKNSRTSMVAEEGADRRGGAMLRAPSWYKEIKPNQT